MKAILDASVAAKWVLPETDSDKALRLRDAYRHGTLQLLAPDCFPGEVAHTLTRAERQARITPGEALRLWSDVMTTSPVLVASLPLMHRAIAISSRMRIGVFDCLFVALAEREGCDFVSADDRLVRALQAQLPFVVTLAAMP